MCHFTIDFHGSAAEIAAKAKQAIEEQGGTLDTNSPTTGTFHSPLPIGGHIDGSYEVNDAGIEINITHKPFILSCDTIKTKLEKLLNEN